MVKIRLRRIGAKGRPFYRVVVAPSTAARNGRTVETIGTYDPTVKPTHINIKEDRAMHWLLSGAQPTETTAYLLNKTGILGKYLEQRPEKKKDYKFLDKTTAAISKPSVVDAPAAKTKAEPVAEAAPAPVAVEEPVAAAPEAVEESAAVDAPVEEPAGDVPAEEISAEATPTEE
jgi:small subunit ribosomal protein S16